jgi:RsiW-degrading membrane proteinase PrsW (M82 family)
MGSEYRKPSASADEHYQHIPGVSSPTAATGQQSIPPGNGRVEEPIYQEHGINLSGQQPVESPSFYPADLLERQQEEERWQASLVQPQPKNGVYPSSQGQPAYGTVPPAPASLPQQGAVPYAPNPQYPPSAPQPQYPPYSQPYRNAPIPYTDPRAYQQQFNGYTQQSQPQAYPGYSYHRPVYPYQGRTVINYLPNGYQQRAYPAYPPPTYPYAWYPPPPPRRNGYQLGMAIVSLVGSILGVIVGIFCGIILLTVAIAPNTNMSQSAIFASTVFLTALMLAGIIGGTFGIIHSSFALALRPSRPFKLPPFWSFLLIYVFLVIVGFLGEANDAIINNFPLAFLLIALSAILPALAFLALALRRLRRPGTRQWPTTWRRFTLALVSGATAGILLAGIFEPILTLIARLEAVGINTSFMNDPNASIPHDLRSVVFALTIYAVIAPIVEEGFKPLAVVTMIGRIRSASEAFILGMACGIGFDLMETVSYMGMGYHRWINVAIDRSTTGLLHGFGAGMMALGWYYITHKDALKRSHLQIGLGCMLYAILQHAIWNGSFVLVFLPSPIGPYLENGTIPIFGYQLDAFLIVYMILSVLILCFLWFVTGKIRLQPDAPLGDKNKPRNQTNPAPEKATQTS